MLKGIRQMKNMMQGDVSIVKEMVKTNAPEIEKDIVNFLQELPKTEGLQNALMIIETNGKIIAVNAQTNESNEITGTLPIYIKGEKFDFLTIENIINALM